MKDFTFETFKMILLSLQSGGYHIMPFLEFINIKKISSRYVILRHDVDRFLMQTLQMARMEADNGIRATYYFRAIPSIFKPDIIKEVVELGHEIGYHYEDLSICHGNKNKSIEHFKKNLDELRNYYPVKTICMHGSPLSKWDNKSIWQHYDYCEFGITGDTSFDVDYNKLFYITDNGRAWNKTSVSIRDKVESPFKIPIKNSFHMIDLINDGNIPREVMINAHPDTFFDFGMRYLLNWGYIESKNIVKRFIVKHGLIK